MIFKSKWVSSIKTNLIIYNDVEEIFCGIYIPQKTD